MAIRGFTLTHGVILLLSMFLLSACTEPKPSNTQSALIVWKSPSFRYADMGFVSDNGRTLKVEIYGSGAALMRLKIGEKSICMSQLKCMSKRNFNQQLLSSFYPDDTLENIFRAKPIFGGLGLTQKRNGFTQKIKKNQAYEIKYTVLNKQTIFRDTINKIMIKVTIQ